MLAINIIITFIVLYCFAWNKRSELMNIEELNKIILLNKQGLLSDEALAYTIEEIYKVGKASDNLEEKKDAKEENQERIAEHKRKIENIKARYNEEAYWQNNEEYQQAYDFLANLKRRAWDPVNLNFIYTDNLYSEEELKKMSQAELIDLAETYKEAQNKAESYQKEHKEEIKEQVKEIKAKQNEGRVARAKSLELEKDKKTEQERNLMTAFEFYNAGNISAQDLSFIIKSMSGSDNENLIQSNLSKLDENKKRLDFYSWQNDKNQIKKSYDEAMRFLNNYMIVTKADNESMYYSPKELAKMSMFEIINLKDMIKEKIGEKRFKEISELKLDTPNLDVDSNSINNVESHEDRQESSKNDKAVVSTEFKLDETKPFSNEMNDNIERALNSTLEPSSEIQEKAKSNEVNVNISQDYLPEDDEPIKMGFYIPDNGKVTNQDSEYTDGIKEDSLPKELQDELGSALGISNNSKTQAEAQSDLSPEIAAELDDYMMAAWQPESQVTDQREVVVEERPNQRETNAQTQMLENLQSRVYNIDNDYEVESSRPKRIVNGIKSAANLVKKYAKQVAHIASVGLGKKLLTGDGHENFEYNFAINNIYDRAR